MRGRLAVRVVVVLVALTLGVGPASAGQRKWVGAGVVVAGAGLAAAAFNYREQCPPGYTSHRFQGMSTQCVYLSRAGSDVRTASTAATFARPPLAWAGGAVAAAGVILLLWPSSPPVTVSVSPRGVSASRVVRF